MLRNPAYITGRAFSSASVALPSWSSPSVISRIERDTDARGRPVERRVDRMVGTREISMLRTAPGVQRLNLPQLQGGELQIRAERADGALRRQRGLDGGLRQRKAVECL